MAAVLADLTVESWAATLTGLRLADLVDAQSTAAAADAAGLLRIALPAAKFWTCKRAVPALAEALECLGGNGYDERFPMARLLRESPLNGIWEGSGTITALDAIRALRRNPECADSLLAELATATGGHPAFDGRVKELAVLMRAEPDPAAARRLCSLAARMFAASLLIRHAPAHVADLYCATRLDWTGDRVFGELPPGTATRGIVASVTPRPGEPPAGMVSSGRSR
jgi:putative acyl-CoA dehydrogenase